MAAKEGFRRIRRTAQICIAAGALFLLFAFIVALLGAHLPQYVGIVPVAALLIPGLYLTVLGWLGRIIGWIGEGFAAKED